MANNRTYNISYHDANMKDNFLRLHSKKGCEILLKGTDVCLVLKCSKCKRYLKYGRRAFDMELVGEF